MWAVIGGSGFEKFSDVKTLEEYKIETPFGRTSSGLKKVSVDGRECLFLSRHGAHHELLPSEVNYRANIFALKKLGAQQILAFSAVGSLQKECAPGDLVVPNQYIDRTKSLRKHTYCGEGVVGHVSLAHPVCKHWTETLQKLCGGFEFKTHFKKTYVCIEGPYFSTQAESLSYIAAGAQIIGMTNFPEFALAREAGLGYVPCCFVTDYDCWDDSIHHVTLTEVIETMRKNNSKAFAILRKILAEPVPSREKLGYAEAGLKTGLMCDVGALPSATRQWLDVVTG